MYHIKAIPHKDCRSITSVNFSVSGNGDDSEEKTTKRDLAKDFLCELLANGTISANEIYSAAKANQISSKTLQRSKKALGIISYSEGAEAMSITAQKERDEARALRKNQESYIRGTAQKMAQKIADKRIDEMFGDIPDKRGKRLEAFCVQIKFSDGKTALQAFEEQEKALRARSRGHGR